MYRGASVPFGCRCHNLRSAIRRCASPPTDGRLRGRDIYFDSAELGASDIVRHLNRYFADCPGSPVVLAGYSQGALAIRIALPQLANDLAEAIASVQLIADPARQADAPYIQRGTANAASEGILTRFGVDLPHNPVTAGRTDSFCNSNDLICAPPNRAYYLLRAGALTTPAGPLLIGAVIASELNIHTDSYNGADLALAGELAALDAANDLGG